MIRSIFSSSLLLALVCSLGLLLGPPQPVSAGLGGEEEPGPLPGYFSLWPEGRMDVLISKSFTKPEKRMIALALLTWGYATEHAVRFYEISQKPASPDSRYVHILTPSEFAAETGEAQPTGCGSWGPHTNGPTYLWLQQPDCPNDLPSILHESGHTIGLGHEHLRLDRNFYMGFIGNFLPPDDPPQKRTRGLIRLLLNHAL
jgi:hypothetical protein